MRASSLQCRERCFPTLQLVTNRKRAFWTIVTDRADCCVVAF
jgi:hypothetical protein